MIKEHVPKLGKEELISIWDQAEDNYSLIQTAYDLGFKRGQADQLRKNDHELNAVLHVLEKSNGTTFPG